jgi:hypothetical protein
VFIAILVGLRAPLFAAEFTPLLPISRSTGKVIPFTDGEIIKMEKGNLEIMFQVKRNEECSAASYCDFISVKTRRAERLPTTIDWEIAPEEQVPFTGKDSVGFHFGFTDYPHFFEDYYQTVVFVQEKNTRGLGLVAYVASREIGEIAPLPAPVYFVKYEMMSGTGNGQEQLRHHFHFVPVGMMRSRGVYSNAQVALYCEIGIKPAHMKDNFGGVSDKTYCQKSHE